MTPTNKEPASDREILLVGPYGVLGTGVIDAVAANPAWRGPHHPQNPGRQASTSMPHGRCSGSAALLRLALL
jgi:hypothetical protein